MARKTSYGRYILSAGEIGAYTVCPESWRLKSIKRVNSVRKDEVKLGKQLHREWAESLDEARFLSIGMRVVVLMILMAVIIYAVL